MHTEYSPFDRSIHRLAMRLRRHQVRLAELESDLYQGILSQTQVTNRVYIAGLPRSGSTLLLRLLSSLPGACVYRYWNMPFLFIPIFWNDLSHWFRREEKLTERAHGDGVQISFDSPEALGEVIWNYFWPHKYSDAGICLWSDEDANPEFEKFYDTQIKKLCLLQTRRKGPCESTFYVAKNSTHVARIRYLRKLYPEATILVPFRNPADHVHSLIQQHRNFLEKDGQDSFVGEYMRSIGHFEFGPTLRHIVTPNSEKWISMANSGSVDYWLCYWGRIYEYLLDQRESCVFIDFDAMCDRPNDILGKLEEKLGLAPTSLTRMAPQVRSTRRLQGDILDYTTELVTRCLGIHNGLKEAAGTFTSSIRIQATFQ